ncbi:MAG TPA: hypothetical protein VIS51_08300 [Solirubrobacterales bacterium]
MDRLSELFPAGPPIGEDQQIGRHQFIESVEERLRSGDVLIFADERRKGKTSVARASLARIRSAGGAVAEINLASHGKDHLGAAGVLASELAGELGRRARRLGDTARRLRRSGADKATGADGGTVVALAAELLGPDRTIDSVIRKAARRNDGNGCAILLDEAHVIAKWPEDVQQAFNAALRDSGSLGMVIASSERRATELLLDDGQPLYSAGYPMPLPEIDAASWVDGLTERFEELGMEVERPALEELVAFSNHHPYCTMRLAAETALQAEQARRMKGDQRGTIDSLAIQAALVVVREDGVWKTVIE